MGFSWRCWLDQTCSRSFLLEVVLISAASDMTALKFQLKLFDAECVNKYSKRLGVLKSLEELEHNPIDKKL